MKTPRSSWISVLALSSIFFPFPLAGQAPPTVSWHGEIRPRAENREPVGGEWEFLISMRTRLAADIRLDGGMGLFFQLQDVRTWGEELSVRDRSADAMDFHQAYLEVEELPVVRGKIRAGRQEVALAASRLIGAPDWGQGGQAFDGARWIRPTGDGRLEVIYLRTQENSTPDHEESADLLAAWYELSGAAGGTAHFYMVHNRFVGLQETEQSSLGGIWSREIWPLSLTFQGIYQTGIREGVDLRASFVSAQGSLSLPGGGSVGLWYDRLSGDEDPEDDLDEAFSTLYGARHRYYGRADYFVDIPGDTRGLGLQDAALKLSWEPRPEVKLNLDIHSFQSVVKGPLSSRRLGEEVDGWVQLRVRRHLAIQAGYTITWAGPGMEELDLLQGTGQFGYFMTSLRF